MKKYSKEKPLSRESIIGLGEDSFRKNYYPELQEKIHDLETINVRNRAIITAIPDVLLISDVDGNITPLSGNLRAQKPVMEEFLKSEVIMNRLKHCVAQVVDTHNIVTESFELLYDEHTQYYEVRAHLSEIDEVLLIIRDMTNRVTLESQLRFMAERDGLTEVFNRWSFEQHLNSFKNQQFFNLGLLVIDINGVKFINDTLGHAYGDKIIRGTSRILCDIFEEQGIISRIGGDEFAVILPNIYPDVIKAKIEVLDKKVQKYNEQEEKIQLSIAYGYSYHDKGIVDTEKMYQEADNNMYQNKLLKSQSNRSHVVNSLMKALEVRDYITEGHADRMENMAIELGYALELAPAQIDRIALLAKFHDIGKVGIPDAILNKPSRLTEEEYSIMKTHSQIGERIAVESGELKEIAHLILKHHEKYDGTGYPLGIKELEIPVECRILGIVDAFDAMTNDRPYRKALSIEEAISELIRCSGTQFDPELVEIFIDNYK